MTGSWHPRGGLPRRTIWTGSLGAAAFSPGSWEHPPLTDGPDRAAIRASGSWCPVCKNTRTMMTVVNGAVYLRFSRAA